MRIRDYIRDEVFAKRVGQAGCLIVYDPARRYGELTRALDSPKCRVLDATASVIEQREAAMSGLQALASGELEGIVVWCPSALPRTDDELQGDPFSVLAGLGARFPAGDGDDYASLCRRAKPEHVVELDRLFAEGEPPFDVVDALDTGGSWPKLKTLLRATSAREILVGLLAPMKEQESALRDDATWASEAREFVQRAIGHKLQTKGHTRSAIGDELWRVVLFSEFMFDSDGQLPASLTTVPRAHESARQLIFDVCEGLRKHQDLRGAYIAKAQEIERDLLLEERSATLTNLGLRDTFAFEERFFLAKYAAAVQADDLESARQTVVSRQQSIWLSHEDRLAEWTVAERALDLLETLNKYEDPALSSLGGVVAAYVDRFRETDRRHRELEQAVSEWHDDHEQLADVVACARKKYFRFAERLQQLFVQRVEQEGWPIGGTLLRNTEVFDREVAPALADGRRVAYFLVDSLRYELAVELEKQLSAKHVVKLQPVCAQLPTYTEVGMASLMPEAATALSLAPREGKLVTTLAGAWTRNPTERFTYLKSRKGDLCHDMHLDEVVHGKKLKVPDKVKLLVVRTTEIDAVATTSARAVLTQIPTVLRQLIKAIARVEATGFQKVVVATDHGFILVHEQQAGNVAPKPPGNWLMQKSRCLLGEGSPASGSVLLNCGHVGIPGDSQHYAAPRTLVPYVREELYYHEGLSLQECVLPCLTIDFSPQPAKAPAPTLLISYKQGRSDKITTRRPVVDLAWPGLMFDEQEIEIAVDAVDAKGSTVGEVGTGPAVNPATQGVRIRPGQAISIGLRMQDEFSGSFTVRAIDPSTQALLADLKLKTDYAV
jgi:hypothetical protein